MPSSSRLGTVTWPEKSPDPIAESLMRQTVAYCAYNEKLRAHKIVPELSSYKQKQTSGTWGTVIRTPAGVSSMLGI